MRLLYCGLILFLLSVSGCRPNVDSSSPEKPRLVVLISLDQFRWDYFERFSPFFGDGGFKRFSDEGGVLSNVRYRHAATLTCPGHAAISTGASGNVNGIIGNDWYDLEEHRSVYCAEDTTVRLIGHPGVGRSPRLLMSETVTDLLKESLPESKIYAVAGKDRSAIMLAGHLAEAAFWLQDSVMITSSYYLDELPAWVEAFNARRLPQHLHGAVWDRIMPQAKYDSTQGPDDFWNEEDHQALGKTFPHVITGGSANLDNNFYEALRKSPFEDEILLQFVEDLVVNEQIGQDDVTDLVAIGFSTVDRIGHPYGPDSHEIMDNVVRTDRVLANLFSFLDERVGMDQVLVVLTADHGVQRLPELVADPDHGIWAARVSGTTMRQDVRAALESSYGPLREGTTDWIENLMYPHLYFNRIALAEKGISVAEAAAALVDALPQLPQYSAVVTASNPVPSTSPEPYSVYPGRSGDVLIRLSDHHINRNSEFGTTHGTPWDGDRHVPMLWLGRAVKHTVIEDSLNVVDLAPTLAKFLDLKQPSTMSGKIVEGLFATPTE